MNDHKKFCSFEACPLASEYTSASNDNIDILTDVQDGVDASDYDIITPAITIESPLLTLFDKTVSEFEELLCL